MTNRSIQFNSVNYVKEPFFGMPAGAVSVAAMMGPDALELYNMVASNLGKSRVKRFADLKTAARRTWEVLTEWADQSDSDFEMSAEELAAQKLRVKDELDPPHSSVDAPQPPLEERQAQSKALGFDVPETKAAAPVDAADQLIEKAAAAAVKKQAQTLLRSNPPASNNPAKDAEMPALRKALKVLDLKPKAKVYARRRGSKQALLVDMLSRKEGATFGELYDALASNGKPWRCATIRSGLAWDMNHIAGYGIRSELFNGEEFAAQGRDYEAQRLGIVGDERGNFNVPGPGYDPDLKLAVYFLTYPDGMNAPVDHVGKTKD